MGRLGKLFFVTNIIMIATYGGYHAVLWMYWSFISDTSADLTEVIRMEASKGRQIIKLEHITSTIRYFDNWDTVCAITPAVNEEEFILQNRFEPQSPLSRLADERHFKQSYSMELLFISHETITRTQRYNNIAAFNEKTIYFEPMKSSICIPRGDAYVFKWGQKNYRGYKEPIFYLGKPSLTLIEYLKTHKSWFAFGIDLNGDGKVTHKKIGDYGIKFSNGGYALTEMIGGRDGVLFIDKNGNERPDEVGEFLGSGGDTSNLFSFDANADGVIDENDPEFNRIRIWHDPRIFGALTPSSLSGPIRIPAPKEEYTNLFSGNLLVKEIELRMSPAQTYFAYPNGQSDVVNLNVYDIPDLAGGGNIPDLRTAAMKNPDLHQSAQELSDMELWYVLQNFNAVSEKFDHLLYMWTGTDKIDPSSMGPDVKDARQLEAVIAYTAMPYQRLGTSITAPGKTGARKMESIYQFLKSAMFFNFLLGSDNANTLFINPGFKTDEGKPTIYSDVLRNLGQRAARTKDPDGYMAALVLYVATANNDPLLENLTAAEEVSFRNAVKESKSVHDWEYLKKNYMTLLPCAPCFSAPAAN